MVASARRQTDPASPEFVDPAGAAVKGKGKRPSNTRPLNGSVDKPGTLRRLARSHFDLLARVESGELSAHAAAVLLEQSLSAIERAAETMAKAPELMTATEAGKKGGRGKKASNLLTLPTSSNDKNRLAARIKRDHPEIAARVANGEFKSIRAAALEAGIVKPMRSIPVDTPPEALGAP